MKDKLTEEEQQLTESAQVAHNLRELSTSNGWKYVREKFFDDKLKECREYLEDITKNDMTMIQAYRLQIDFIQTLLNEIEVQIEVGMQDEEDLEERKERKREK